MRLDTVFKIVLILFAPAGVKKIPFTYFNVPEMEKIRSTGQNQEVETFTIKDLLLETSSLMILRQLVD